MEVNSREVTDHSLWVTAVSSSGSGGTVAISSPRWIPAGAISRRSGLSMLSRLERVLNTRFWTATTARSAAASPARAPSPPRMSPPVRRSCATARPNATSSPTDTPVNGAGPRGFRHALLVAGEKPGERCSGRRPGGPRGSLHLTRAQRQLMGEAVPEQRLAAGRRRDVQSHRGGLGNVPRGRSQHGRRVRGGSGGVRNTGCRCRSGGRRRADGGLGGVIGHGRPRRPPGRATRRSGEQSGAGRPKPRNPVRTMARPRRPLSPHRVIPPRRVARRSPGPPIGPAVRGRRVGD